MTLRLIRPDPRFESSHASFIAEFQARGEELVPWVLAEQRSPFADYVAWLESSAKGVDLPTGFVPHDLVAGGRRGRDTGCGQRAPRTDR